MNKFLLVLIILGISNSHAQLNDLDKIEKSEGLSSKVYDLNNKAVSLSLQEAIADGLRKNSQELARKYHFQLNNIIFQDAHDDFYYPKLNLTMARSSDHFTENLYRDVKDNAQSAKTPTGAMGLELEDYTLFNWGKDYLDYLNAKDTYKRSKENLTEDKRELRFQIIAEYFNLSRLNSIVRIYKKQLSHTSFVYRLAKEKMTLRKISSQEFLQAKSMFLESHKNYHGSLFDYYKVQESLATILGDNLKSNYKPSDTLKFKPISFSPGESYQFVNKNSRDVLDARTEMKNSARSHQKVLKNNLPLPKFSLKLGSYQRAFSSNGYEDNYETFAGSNNIEVAATLNMSWRIYGSGGFFNSRKTETSFYNMKISEIKLREVHRNAEVANRLTHSRIQYLEKKFEAVTAELKNSRKVFDRGIDNYLASKTKFTNIKQILDELLSSSVHFENTKYEHLLEKLTLAKLMGVDDFPGEQFDRLVER